MAPEEIARRELERLEKKKRKQERRLLKSQNKFQSGDLLHTPGSDSDSGVSHVTDSDHIPCQPFDSVGGNQSCDQTPHSFQTPDQNQRHLDQDASAPELDSPDASHRSSLCSDTSRASGAQKLNPFSVESLLSDSRPRRNLAALPSSRPLIGKGHFLLYPITQPLGFIVPQTALKPTAAAAAATAAAAAANPDSDSPAERNHSGVSARSAGCRSSSPDSADASAQSGQVTPAEKAHGSPPRAALSAGKSTHISVICGDSTFAHEHGAQVIQPVDADRKGHSESKEQPVSTCAENNSDSKEDVDLE